MTLDNKAPGLQGRSGEAFCQHGNNLTPLKDVGTKLDGVFGGKDALESRNEDFVIVFSYE